MTIFEKLNEARLRFQNAGIQKSGKNAYAGYTYYELSDILPAVNKLANELKFCCVVNFENEIARLDFIHEKNLSHTTAFYSFNEDDTIKVVNKGFDFVSLEIFSHFGKISFKNSSADNSLENFPKLNIFNWPIF